MKKLLKAAVHINSVIKTAQNKGSEKQLRKYRTGWETAFRGN